MSIILIFIPTRFFKVWIIDCLYTHEVEFHAYEV